MAVDDVSRNAGIQAPFAACMPEGTFVFVSYAHADKAVVYPELKRTAARGVRVWFDEGITPSSEWPEEVARALDLACLFVVMITPAAVASRNVRNEVNAALSWGKPVLAIHLTRTVLPKSMELQLGSLQAILRWQMDDDAYARKLAQVLAAYAISGTEAPQAVAQIQQVDPGRASSGSSSVPVPAQLPSMPADFVNRTAELGLLRAELRKGTHGRQPALRRGVRDRGPPPRHGQASMGAHPLGWRSA